MPLLRRVREVTRESKDIIDFASGELSNDLFPEDHLRKFMSESEFPYHFGYEHPQGHFPLRETLVNHVKKYHNICTTPSSILITSGGQQALFLITQCLLSPGDAVAIEEPSYAYSLALFQSAGLRLFRLPVDSKGIHPEDVVQLYRKHRIRMVFLNPWYQNPTGTVLTTERKTELLKVSTELGIPIVEDDPFSLLSLSKDSILPLKSSDSSGNVLYIGSLSKVIASTLRVGWLIGPQSVIDRLADARQQMDFGLSILPQWIANQFLMSDHFQMHLEKLRESLRFRRDTLVSALNKYLIDEVEYSLPDGGLHIWCKLNRIKNDHRLLEESISQGVIVTPGRVFGSEDGYVRLTYARVPDSRIYDGVRRLAQAIKR